MLQPTSILKDSPNPPPQQLHDPGAANAQQMSRPRIQLPSLQIPVPGAPMPTIHTASPPQIHSPYGVWLPSAAGHPLTPVAGIPPMGIHSGPTGLPIGLAGSMGRFTFYPSKAGEFMFKQFEGFKDFTMNTAKSGLSHGEKTAFWLHGKISFWSRRWFTHIFLILIILAFSLLGALILIAVEGPLEDAHLRRTIEDKENILTKRNKLLDDLHKLTKDEYISADKVVWTGKAHEKLVMYEAALQKYIRNYKDQDIPSESEVKGTKKDQEDLKQRTLRERERKVWTYWNAVFYCATIYTTIGYGHIAPSTTTGRAITIVYAIIGIPLFLIVLADFGKLFTRSIKFVWSFVRRLFYTGSCRKVRRTQPVQDVMKGVQMVYDFATFRRPSQMYAPNPEGIEEAGVPLKHPQLGTTHLSPSAAALPQAHYKNWPHVAGLPIPGTAGTDTPATPAPSAFEVDDEFNLPISVAITLLLMYMFAGAALFWLLEDSWGFFESFYFVFISMSTIGFGDFVPENPAYLMASNIYLIFGLALTSMCINVVQEKLSDSFRQASAKIGATIGLRLAEEESAAAAEAESAKNSAEVQEEANAENNLSGVASS